MSLSNYLERCRIFPDVVSITSRTQDIKEICGSFTPAGEHIVHEYLDITERQRNIPHEEYMETMKNVRDTATHREFHEDPFKVSNNIHQRHKEYHDMLDRLTKRMGGTKILSIYSGDRKNEE